jgi:hypothetical protein
VTLKFTNRHIEVAQVLRDHPCKFARVVAHYQRHAEANEAVFARSAVTATLSHAPATSFFGDLPAGYSRNQIVLAVQSIIEPVLTAMNADRASARGEVDTPAEVTLRESVCAKQL